MWQVASGRENRHLEIGLEGSEAAELLHRGCGSFLAPDEQCRLAQAAECVVNVDVEPPGEERRRGVPGTALV